MSAEHKTSIHDRMGGGLMDGAWRPGVAWRLEQRRRERFRIRMRGRKRGRWFIPSRRRRSDALIAPIASNSRR